MVKKCAIVNCTSRQGGSSTSKLAFFAPPNSPEIRKLWKNFVDNALQTVYPGEKIVNIEKYFVCELHFEEVAVVRKWKAVGPDGRVICETPYKKPRLVEGAVPTRLLTGLEDNSFGIGTSQVPLVRDNSSGEVDVQQKFGGVSQENSPTPQTNLHTPKRQSNEPMCGVSSSSEIKRVRLQYDDAVELSLMNVESNASMSQCVPQLECSEDMPITADIPPIIPLKCLVPEGQVVCCGKDLATAAGPDLFNALLHHGSALKLPPHWSYNLPIGIVKCVTFSQLILTEEKNFNNPSAHVPIVLKQVSIDADLKVTSSLLSISIDVLALIGNDRVNTIADVLAAVNKIDAMEYCRGSGHMTELGTISTKIAVLDVTKKWRSKKCHKLLLPSSGLYCVECTRLRNQALRVMRLLTKKGSAKKVKTPETPRRQKVVNELRRRIKIEQRSKNRQKVRVRLITKKLETLREEIDKVTSESLDEKLLAHQDNISEYQRLVLKEILSCSKAKSVNGRRYTEDWALVCMLLHIRSPACYKFINKNGILPLPCVRTIRRYLALINTKCGFDVAFFDLIKQKLKNKSPKQRRGILMLDEMSTRESISVCSKTLSYKGLTDFGEEASKTTNVHEMANHGLVIMFQPFADSYAQPIAVFASKGVCQGSFLAKIVVKAIVLMEECGAFIDGVVADGATTNRRMWSDLGVNGALGPNFNNSFLHPIDETRKVYMFSDTPHQIKNIRNRLHGSLILKTTPEGLPVNWEHLKTLYKLDSQLPSDLRIAHKLTRAQIDLTNTAKMRVRLATQIFSNSVADGLKFYRGENVPELQDCQGTIDFCLLINNLFDALNRKIPAEGLKIGSTDSTILHEAACILDQWQIYRDSGEIRPEFCLTKSTSEGLRVTIRSAIELSTFLLEHCGFNYVLTGKINQDPLERFFGTIRQAGGSNDHPATPTFLQLYKMLSLYGMVKPPELGNCTLRSANCTGKTMFSFAELKHVYQHRQDVSAMNELKAKLNGLVEEANQDNWDLQVPEEHDYAKSTITDCIIYYCTGYLCRQLNKTTTCPTCQSAFTSTYASSSVARLVELKTRGKLVHPNIGFFNFIKHVEGTFQQYVDSAFVFEDTLSDLIHNYTFQFPCQLHKDDVIAFTLRYYLTMRMRQFSQHQNVQHRKVSREKKNLRNFIIINLIEIQNLS